MRNHRQYVLAVVWAFIGLTAVAYPNDSAADRKAEPVAPTGLIPFELGKPIPVSVAADTKPVTSFNLFSVYKIEFQRDKTSHLTAKIATRTTGLTELPTITYLIHAAV